MTNLEFYELVENNSDAKSWLYSDAQAIWTLSADLNVTIRRDRSINDKVNESWVQSVNGGEKHRFEFYYGSSPVREFFLVSVDGDRAYLPFPNPSNMYIKQEEFMFARCLQKSDVLDSYVKRAGLKY